MKKKIGSALVVGSGISGIRSALDLAEQGYHVTMIDKSPHLGGVLTQLDYQFPTDHCGICRMLPLVERDAGSQYCLRKGLFHENIDILLSTELAALEGEPGKFQATLRRKPTMVDAARCIGCGECSRVCPVVVPDEFNAGLTERKAIYLPVPHNIPNTYVVDLAACTQCGECEKVCPTGAIDFGREARRRFRILVVDDELVVRDSLKEWLIDEGFQVDMAESGLDALEKLGREFYHLMLLDIKMPGMDGVEVLKRAKEMRPELPVVMMTAYATVETAVEAMKLGALDYLMKPFDPDTLVPMLVQLYQRIERAGEEALEVGAVILAAGCDSYDPASGENTYGYGELPNVVTSVEFERLISGTGPNGGKLLRPSDGKPAKKIAWLQCVGSRDRQVDADFCSSACCMFSIKEAVLAKERSGGEVDATIFYMDMRTYGKDFQRYRDRAEQELGVHFCRSRVHTVVPAGKDGQLLIVYADNGGQRQEALFDLVVLAVGQRPAAGTEELAEVLDLERNPWGFCRAEGFSNSGSSRDGVFLGGSFTGLRDISESVIQAGSASLAASRLLHSKGGGLAEQPAKERPYRDVSRELPRVAVALCSCDGALGDLGSTEKWLQGRPATGKVFSLDRVCTPQGWEALQQGLQGRSFNRVLIGTCMPYVYGPKLKQLGDAIGLDPALIEVVDTRTPAFTLDAETPEKVRAAVRNALAMGLGKLRSADPVPLPKAPVNQSALVAGGGIAGMTAALAIADHGFQVTLVEQEKELGGNLRTLQRTIEGGSPRDLLEETVARVEKHPLITLLPGSRVLHSTGHVGRYSTIIENAEGKGETLAHGVVVLAVGGREAETASYGYGESEAVVTQHELEQKLVDGDIDPAAVGTVVMIQCVDSREEPRNYCSRICCASALKNALYLKEQNPDVQVCILYRDLMSYGYLETHFTRARKAGIVFIPYGVENKPQVEVQDGRLHVVVQEPILERPVELKPDLLVLSTGIVPNETRAPAELFGVATGPDGFFAEADSKWRPVDFLKEGVFACGLAHSPRTISESIAMAETAAQRALRILNTETLAAGTVVAEVRHSLCSLCERCIAACPYGARELDEDRNRVLVDEAMCQGCGSCAAVCPNSASVLRGYRDQQVFDVLDAALEGIC